MAQMDIYTKMEIIDRLWHEGASGKEIAEAVGSSYAWTSQIITRMKHEGKLVGEKPVKPKEKKEHTYVKPKPKLPPPPEPAPEGQGVRCNSRTCMKCRYGAESGSGCNYILITGHPRSWPSNDILHVSTTKNCTRFERVVNKAYTDRDGVFHPEAKRKRANM